MKKILFMVGSEKYNSAGWKLFLNYPYGRTINTEWKIMINDTLERDFIEKCTKNFDYLYQIQLGDKIGPFQDDQIIINTLENQVLEGCSYIHTSLIFINEKLTNHFPSDVASILLRYDRTPDAQYDYMRIKNDFLNIIYKHQSQNMPKELYKAERIILKEEKEKYQLNFKEYIQIDSGDKKLLSLPLTERYISTCIDNSDIGNNVYCYINRKIREVIHFNAWLQLKDVS